MSMKDLKKCEECGKNFTHNIGLKGHITAVHERKHTIVVINVFMKKTLNSIMITVCKNFTKVFNLEIISHTKHWIEITNYSCLRK